MARRTGLVTMIFLLERVCRFLVRYRSTIEEAANNDPTLATLFDTLLTTCQAIVDILKPFREVETS